MKHAGPVYEYVCPKCLAPFGEPCVRVRKFKRPVPEVLVTYVHKERHTVRRAWEQPDLFLSKSLDSVRKPAYMGIIERKPLEST